MKENILTPEESAELAGLRAYAAKGKLVPGSDDQRRMLELVRLEGGGERVVVAAPKWDRERVQVFYGVKRRFTYEMEELGGKMGVAPPWEEPVELGKWFAKARGMGLRKKSPPASVDARIRSAEMAALKTAGLPVVDDSPADSPVPSGSGKGKARPPIAHQPELPVVEPGESDAAATLSYLRRKSHLLEQQEIQLRAAGAYDAAALIAAELKEVHHSRRAWELSVGKIRAGDEETQAQVKSHMALFAGAFWQIFRRAFLADCPPSEKPAREAVLNAVATDLPALLEEHFGLRELPAPAAADSPSLAA